MSTKRYDPLDEKCGELAEYILIDSIIYSESNVKALAQLIRDCADGFVCAGESNAAAAPDTDEREDDDEQCNPVPKTKEAACRIA